MTPWRERLAHHFSLSRLAQLGFWFFLIKGLLWLALPAAVWLGWRAD